MKTIEHKKNIAAFAGSVLLAGSLVLSANAQGVPQSTPSPSADAQPLMATIGQPIDDASAGLADERLQASQGAPELSLVEVVALALQNNPSRDAAWAAVRAAQARVGTAKSAGGLSVDLSASGTVSRGFGFPSSIGRGSSLGGIGGGTGGTGTGTGGSFGNSFSNSGPGYNKNESASVGATIPIYSGGRISAGKRIAKYSAQAQIAQAHDFEQVLVYNTTLAYLNILRAQQLLEVSGSNLVVSRERLRVANVRFDAGAAAKLEVLRADTDLANAKQLRINAASSLGQSFSSLNTLMGRAPETPLRVEPIIRLTLPQTLAVTSAASPGIGNPTLPIPTETTNPTASQGGSSAIPTSPSISAGNVNIGIITAAPAAQLQVAAGQSRQSLAVTEAQIKSAEASVDLAKAQRKPKIDIDLLGLVRNPISFAGRFLLSLGGSLAQNLFDSGKSRSQIREAQAVLEQLRFQYKDQELGVADQIEQSLLALDSAQHRLETTDTGVVSAREALRSARLGYSAGAQTSLEVSDAQSALLSAETEAVNARFDVAQAQAQLAAAVGIFPQEAIDAYQLAAKRDKTPPYQSRP